MQTVSIIFWFSLTGLVISFTSRKNKWLISPLLLVMMFISNIPLVLSEHIYLFTMTMQFWFYAAVFAGCVLVENRKVKSRLLFAPYNFFVCNYLLAIGLRNYLKRSPAESSNASHEAESIMLTKQRA